MSREERAAEIKASGLISHFPRHGWDESRIAKYLCSQAEVGEREAEKTKPSASLLGRGADAVEKMLRLRGDYPVEKVDVTVRPLVVLDLDEEDEEAKRE